MSLGGIALAIGVLVDAAIVMVENGYRHLSEAQQAEGGATMTPRERTRILLNAAKQVAPAIFFSIGPVLLCVDFEIFSVEGPVPRGLNEQRLDNSRRHATRRSD
jgi:copper/silver efflux system protein